MKEILTFSFISGPKLPFKLEDSQMVTSSTGSVVLVGGFNHDERKESSALLELRQTSSGSLEWKRMEQNLRFERRSHVVIPIPDNLTSCTDAN